MYTGIFSGAINDMELWITLLPSDHIVEINSQLGRSANGNDRINVEHAAIFSTTHKDIWGNYDIHYDILHNILYHNEVLREYGMHDAVLTFISDNPS